MATGHGPRMTDQLGGSIGSEYTHNSGRDQELRFHGDALQRASARNKISDDERVLRAETRLLAASEADANGVPRWKRNVAQRGDALDSPFQARPETAKPNPTNEREFLRREQIRRLSDSHLAQLRRDLDAEARRRRSKSAENFHEGQTFHKGIRFWRACPICHDRACRSQSCRNAERRIAQGRR